MSETVGLVSCVKQKRDGPAAARDMYTSALFSGARKYAERHADRWFVLSAKYGLLHPDDRIEPYEQTLSGAPVAERRAWSRRVHEQMRDRSLLEPGTEFLWLAGQAYQGELARLLSDHPQRDPLKGLRFGERLRFFADNRSAA